MLRRRALHAVALFVAAPLLACADAPRVGQPGKDVEWVPTAPSVARRMLRMAQTTARDYVIDLGSGDGIIPISAAKEFGARALGIEYDPALVRLARQKAAAAGVARRARFVQGDLFAADFSRASVLTLYLKENLNLALRPQILALSPGTRVVSHRFGMGDWAPDEVSLVDGHRVYLWIVPANVIGAWSLELGPQAPPLELEFEQRFQKIGGYVMLGPVQAGLRDASLRGARIGFSYVDRDGVRREFRGSATRMRMSGSFRADDGARGRWEATKR
ncbi:MAG TPA: class I SAM-dependent methyltransferase [Burkholderiales bacterium]|nr:class I SAM-dependent methyltransferase [Burkholderiales bacterium]